VEENVAGHVRQSEGKGGGDEVDLMSTFGKTLSQFGCDDATPAVRWVTGNADFHESTADSLVMILAK
jgi:hypothetical protein